MPKTPRKAKEHSGEQMEAILYGTPVDPPMSVATRGAWLLKTTVLPNQNGFFPAYQDLAEKGDLQKVIDFVTLDTTPNEADLMRSVLYGAVRGGHIKIVEFVLFVSNITRLRLCVPQVQCEKHTVFRSSEIAAWDALVSRAEKERELASKDKERAARIDELCDYLRKARKDANAKADSFLKK